MHHLQTKLSAESIGLIRKQIGIRFSPDAPVKEREALILYENKMVEETALRTALQMEHKCQFPNFVAGEVSPLIAEHFKGTGFVPISVDVVKHTVNVGILVELKDTICLPYGTYHLRVVPVTVYDYVELYQKYYGEVPWLHELTPSDVFETIVTEAIELKASDLTVSERRHEVLIYYNINKHIVHSSRMLPKKMMVDVDKMLAAKGNASAAYESKHTKYYAIPLVENYRGRVVANRSQHGKVITIRILDNRNQHIALEALNLKDHVVRFIRNKFITLRPGLYLLVGPTMSGKNTTAQAIMYEIYTKFEAKLISVGNPIEILADFMEQIDTETEEQFISAVQSTVRQNPDGIYLTEMTHTTAKDIVETGNQGKFVLSTLHSNGVAEVPSRICDLTGLPIEHITQNIEGIIYQQLLSRKCPVCGDTDRNCKHCYKAGMIPIFETLEITPKLRRSLMGKDRTETYNILSDAMAGKTKFDYAKRLIAEGVISEYEFERWLGETQEDEDEYFFNEVSS